MTGLQYLLQVNIYLTLFFTFYIILLRKETFFTLNRIYLVASGIFSFLIPVLRSDWIRSLFITEQVKQVVIIYTAAPVVYISARVENSLSAADWLLLIYSAGIFIFLIRFLWQLLVVYKSKAVSSQAYSFFGKIIVSENLNERETIVKHENIHAIQWHSADVLLFEIIGIINWFNPIAYAFKKIIKHIHEFIADDNAAAMQPTKADYAMLLVSNVFGIQNKKLTNNFFNQSLLKERIIMLNKEKSTRTALLKYGLSAPLFIGMLIFSSATISNSDLEEYANRVTERSIAFAQQQPSVTYNTFLKRNNAVKSLVYSTNASQVTVNLKNGSKEIYNLKLAADIKKAEAKYGKLPAPVKQAVVVSKPKPAVVKKQEILDVNVVQDPPKFPGSEAAFTKFIRDNYTYSDVAKTNGLVGRVVVSFVVEKDGKLNDIKVLRDIGMGTGEEAVRVVKLMPNWLPALDNGKTVAVRYTLPLSIQSNAPNYTDMSGKVNLQIRGDVPLYVVNGIPTTPEAFNALNMDDIESVTILKDAATGVYGDNGVNGVVVITLRKVK